MSKSKNPSLRYRILNACLTSKIQQFWTREELHAVLAKNDLAISDRQLDYDIEFMRSFFNAPIEPKRYKGFHYDKPGFSIEKFPIIEDELLSFRFAHLILQQFHGSGLVSSFDDLATRVYSLNGNPLKDSTILVDSSRMSCRGLEYLGLVLNALYNQEALNISYQKYGEELITAHVLHPYFIKFYDGRIYVYGKSNKRNINLTFAFDRMVSVTTSDVAFEPNTRINPADIFSNIIGVTMGSGPVEDIELWLSRAQGHYVRDKVLHHSQQILEDNEKGMVVSLKLIVNYELSSYILSKGKSIRVRQPVKLRDAIRKELVEAVEGYDGEG